MVVTRAQEAAQEALFTALAGCDAARALQALQALGSAAPDLCTVSGSTALHWAVAADCADALAALAAAGVSLDAPLGRLALQLAPPWLQQQWDELEPDQRQALVVPGCTALAAACRLGHLASVRRLLELGADASGVGTPMDGLPKPYTPLSATVLTAGDQPSVQPMCAALLAAGADPLAPSVRRRCSVLRCACGSEFLSNGSLALLLDHLVQQAAAGRLAFGSGDAAADVMIAAARCGRVQLFRLAHEFALAASGRRRAAVVGTSSRVQRAARRRAIDTDSDEEEGGEGGSGGGVSADSSVTSDVEAEAEPSGVMVWWHRLLHGGASAPNATWQPSQLQLFEVLRSAALGGSPPILRCILASALPFNVRATDASGNGLLAHCAAHAAQDACIESLGLLYGAGARLTLKRLLYVIEKRPCGEVLASLLAHERPAVTADEATLKAASVVSFTCPIHRLLHAWNRGTQALGHTDPAWRRDIMAALEALLAAGYRPTLYTSLRRPLHILGPGGNGEPQAAPLPFDPFDVLPIRTDEDRRLVLVAKGGEWDTANHAVWPQHFKDAVQALLLSAHRLARSSGERGQASRAERAARRSGGGQAATTLAALPIDLLVQIAAKAASPMSMWM